MKLTYFDVSPPNFGDAINATMWAHLLPKGFLDEDGSELFLGAGSILWDHLPAAPLKHVMGSGFGGYTTPPNLHDGSWNVVWVRGPITAARMRLDPAKAICDAAILLRETPLPSPAQGIDIAFMPHFESVRRGDWRAACALAGITYLDPHGDVSQILSAIRGARLVISEAMHGAIVADALRTPWIAALPFAASHRAKWQDWAASLDLALRPVALAPSTLQEAYTFASGRGGKGRLSRAVLGSGPAAPVNAAFRHAAARRLRRISETVEPQLSADAAIGRATERCMAGLSGFVSERRAAPRARSAG